MGEKENQPGTGSATPGGAKVAAPGASGQTAAPSGQKAAAGHPKTEEMPGTGQAKDRPWPKWSPQSGWTGSDLYPDGWRMGREADGSVWLQSPDGSRADWDAFENRWNAPDNGPPMPTDWGAGHQPTQYPAPDTGSVRP